jgi:4-hydroxymandelate oxidase
MPFAASTRVSNHGGRQLDRTPATVDVLPEIAAAIGDRGEVWVDGGVRRGTDVLTCLALGARAVLAGRLPVWGLAAGGRAGAQTALELMRDELRVAMHLTGCATLADVGPQLLRRGTW